MLVGFLPSTSAADLAMLAAGEGAELAGVPVTGIVRAASVFLERSGRVTVFNEPGPTVDEADWTRLLGEVERRASGHRTVVCSGSLPPGSPVDGYARVVAAARRVGLRSVVDATGEVLASALTAHPDVVSPNLAEAESLLFGPAIERVEPVGEMVLQRAVQAARGAGGSWRPASLVSAGSHGAAFSDGTETLFCPAPKVSVASPIGAGDSLVGGLVACARGQVRRSRTPSGSRLPSRPRRASSRSPAPLMCPERGNWLPRSADVVAPEPSPDSGARNDEQQADDPGRRPGGG